MVSLCCHGAGWTCMREIRKGERAPQRGLSNSPPELRTHDNVTMGAVAEIQTGQANQSQARLIMAPWRNCNVCRVLDMRWVSNHRIESLKYPEWCIYITHFWLACHHLHGWRKQLWELWFWRGRNDGRHQPGSMEWRTVWEPRVLVSI